MLLRRSALALRPSARLGAVAVTARPPPQLLQHHHPRTLLALRRALSSSSSDGEKKKPEGEQQQQQQQEAASSGSSSSEASPPPLHERFVSDMSALFEALKSKLSGSGSGSGSAASTSGGGEGGPPGPDAGEGAVVVRPPTFWEKFSNQESPFFSRLRGMMGGAGDAAGEAGDRVSGWMGETEEAEAMTMLREQLPAFSREGFLGEVQDDLMPKVIGSYLRGTTEDLEVLRSTCREQAYAMFSSSVNERKERQMRMDSRILYMSEPELESIKIIGGQPTPIIAFETHQLYCVRNVMTNKIVEGDEDDIRAFHYLWALQLNEDPEAEDKWQVTEFAIRGVLDTY
jgi:hypothetical protein